MELLEKFEKGRVNRSYQRIDGKYHVNIFLGYNTDGKMSLVISERGKSAKLKSTKVIRVEMKQLADGKKQLYFDLLDPAFQSMFLVFCQDVILVCEKAGPELAISNAIMRWKYWKEMFGTKRSNLLDKNEIKGLIGELILLKDYFIPKYGDQKSMNSWMGPLLGHKDFEINDTWYEAKSINESALQVSISSLEQLDSERDGHLSVVRLEETNAEVESAITLNQMVIKIAELLTDPEILEEFREKLDAVGYSIDPEYDNFSFMFKGKQTYCVTREFPRLTRANVNPAIGNVKYSILLASIETFKEND